MCFPKYQQGIVASAEGFLILPSQTGWCKVYRLPSPGTSDKSGLALDGDLKNEDTTFASSTIKVCLKLPFSPILSFILTHPNPKPDVAATGGEGACLTDNLLDDFQFSEGGRPDDESSGGEGGRITTSSPLPHQPISNSGSSTVAAAASILQMANVLPQSQS
ncbi:hypothetical protein Aperf_G00000092700 [Anoplocephala perfoliata]